MPSLNLRSSQGPRLQGFQRGGVPTSRIRTWRRDSCTLPEFFGENPSAFVHNVGFLRVETEPRDKELEW